MKFSEHQDSNILTVKHYQPGSVKINDRTIDKSCYCNQQQLIENWGCRKIEELNKEHLDELISLKPDVIILGTGEQQVFPSAELFAYCSQQGIGLDVMNNSAACRTYNVITTEERYVVLALIL
jgi:uncharacterized protein